MTDRPPTLADFKAPYPEPGPGQTCCIILLEEKPDEEENYRVELIPGRVMEDGLATGTVSGVVREEVIHGWGYSYYVVEMEPLVTTRRSIRSFHRPTRFVPVPTKHFIRYNSQLPVVVYLPHNTELRYRVWTPIDMQKVEPTEPEGLLKIEERAG
ncbi:ecotin family (I11), putative [Trypanosoma equiperdum]|uniref:Ecotin family (I11), putative n=1 Tax=Trypanosoma equiperdum TaxID=5694 RepID=A0A1G4IGI2_TRYEQ|nr:ecotin family (I11), putative [Trypanosoma equiperdum]